MALNEQEHDAQQYRGPHEADEMPLTLVSRKREQAMDQRHAKVNNSAVLVITGSQKGYG